MKLGTRLGLCHSRCHRCSSHPRRAELLLAGQSQHEGPAQALWAGAGVTRVSPHGEVPVNPSFLSGLSSLGQPLARVLGVMESVMGQFKFSLLSALPQNGIFVSHEVPGEVEIPLPPVTAWALCGIPSSLCGAGHPLQPPCSGGPLHPPCLQMWFGVPLLPGL